MVRKKKENEIHTKRRKNIRISKMYEKKRKVENTKREDGEYLWLSEWLRKFEEYFTNN